MQRNLAMGGSEKQAPALPMQMLFMNAWQRSHSALFTLKLFTNSLHYHTFESTLNENVQKRQ